MPKAYSADIRMLVIAHVEGGASRREAAEQLDISPSAAVKWVKCFHETGSCAAKPRGGSTSPLEAHAPWLLTLIEEQPDLTLDELVAAMRKRGIPECGLAVLRSTRHQPQKNVVRCGAKARGGCSRAPEVGYEGKVCLTRHSWCSSRKAGQIPAWCDCAAAVRAASG